MPSTHAATVDMELASDTAAKFRHIKANMSSSELRSNDAGLSYGQSCPGVIATYFHN